MENSDTATLAGGCFWCTEAIFQRLNGVVSVIPGYCGGDTPDPSYSEVSGGKTGHVEAVQIKFGPKEVSFENLLGVFFKTHDPTQTDGQGNDTGTQYRSVVFYHNKNQKKTLMGVIKKINELKIYDRPVVTQIAPFKIFYPGEDYHVNYFLKNRDAPYCRFVINPKIKRLGELFPKLVKNPG